MYLGVQLNFYNEFFVIIKNMVVWGHIAQKAELGLKQALFIRFLILINGSLISFF